MTGGTLVLGLINGILIGLLAVGIVLVYKSNRFLNVSHAQLGVLSTQLLGKAVLDGGWNWWVAFVVCVPVGVAIGGLVDWFLVRPLRERSASAVSLLLVTLGVSQILLVFTYIPLFGPSQKKLFSSPYPQPFISHLQVGGAPVSADSLLIVIMIPLLVAGLAAFLRYSVIGKTIRAAASNPDEARLCGVSTRRVSLITWGIAGGISAITGILQAPTQSAFSAAELGPYLLLLGLGAAAIGAFVSIPLALGGGVFIGVVHQLVVGGTSSGGDGELSVLLLVIAIVLVRGRAIGRVFTSGGAVVQDISPLRIPESLRKSPVVTGQRPLTVLAALLVAAVLPFLPVLRSDTHRQQLAFILVFGLVALSLTVAIGWAGQVSLGQFALVGAGAFPAAKLLNDNWSLPFLLIICGAIAAVIMVAIGLPALRVPGLTLAVTTLGFAVVGPDWLFQQGWFGSKGQGTLDVTNPAVLRGIGRPAGFLSVYFFALIVVAAVSFGLWAVRRSLPGRLIVAVRDNEAAAAAFGVTPATAKLAALALSGFLAGAAGVLWADAARSVDPTQFTANVSISVLAIPVIGGVGSIGGALTAAGLLYAFNYFVSPHLSSVFPAGNAGVASVLLVGGLGLVLVLHRYPQGIAGAVQSMWQRRLERMDAAVGERTVAAPEQLLLVEDVHLAFGGLRALNGTSIEVRAGEIVGLIGPNGAGKTTLLNVISGRLHADVGRVVLSGADVSDLDPEMRSAYGLSRSFQDARLFPGLTVLETIQVALSNRYRVGLVSSMMGAPWVRNSESGSRAEAESIVDRLGLTPWRDALTADLSTGTRRICDLAAQVAARPKLLLLDEPTAGVAQREAEAFGPLLRRIREELDCAIVIVEHDMPLLMGLCDRIYAMVQGEVIASGSPHDIRSNPAVIASYLGTDEVAITRSGGVGAASPDPTVELPSMAGVATAAPPRSATTRKAASPRKPASATATARSRPRKATDG